MPIEPANSFCGKGFLLGPQHREETQVVKTVVEPSPPPAPAPAPAPAPPPPPPAIDPVQIANAVELVLRKDMGMLSDRLTRAQLETQRMKVERDDMLISLREVESSMREHAASIHNKGSQDAHDLKATREQLTQAHTDLKSLRVENEGLASQLGLAQAQQKMVQEERDTLLQAMTNPHRPPEGIPGPAGQQDASALSATLLESERRNQKLEQKVSTLDAEVTTLRSQLIRSMKEAAASGDGLPLTSSSRPQGADSNLQRALSVAEEQQQVLKARAAELEQQLEQQKQQSGAMMEGLQGELSLYQQQAAELRRDLMAAKAAATSSARQAQAAEVVAQEARAAAAAATAAAAEADFRASHAGMRGMEPGPELSALQGRNKELEQAAQQLQAELMALTRDKQNLEAQVEEFERIQGMQHQQPQLQPPQQQEFTTPPQQPEYIPPPASPLPLDIPQSIGTPPGPSASTRPSPQESRALYQGSLSHVAGLGPDRLAVYVEEEARVHSEKPFEYEDDDEARFRQALPHELPGTAYGGAMTELQHRWAGAVQGLQGSDAQERAQFLRDALLTHLELVKRRTIQKGKEHMVAPDPAADHAALLAYNARGPGSAALCVPVPPRQPVDLPFAPTFAQPPPVPINQPFPQQPPTSVDPQPQLPQQQQQQTPAQAQPQPPQRQAAPEQPQPPQQQQHAMPAQPQPLLLPQQQHTQAQPQPQQGEHMLPPNSEHTNPPQQQQQPQPSPMHQWHRNQEQQLTEMQQQFQQQTQEKAQQRQQQQQQQQQQQVQLQSQPSSASPQSTQSGGLQGGLSNSRDAPDESLTQMAKSRFAPQPQQQATRPTQPHSHTFVDRHATCQISSRLPVSRFTPAHPQPDSLPKPRPILRQSSPEPEGQKGSTQQRTAGAGEGHGPAAAAAHDGPPAPQQPLRQAHWLDPPSRPDTPGSADKADTEGDQGSVHSFNPNDTFSPGATEGGTKEGTGDDWNETIKSIGVSELGDDFLGSDSKNASGKQPAAGRRAAKPAPTQQQQQQQQQGATSSKPAAARPSAVQRVLERQNSFDSVSELEV
ncbi:hypothetical protein DUNSADRAFT_3771 [Dunaliella salina]|uniref:Uncharacterized protein n=1 Tax=Dunaliella salina TaxID=3046 RepID=A0ABQ7GTE3_DUNSA|nr:hypothetical protein DUNSADRAFT_3771 [Dunaliella salina]|eukprot:KAF5837878.1 hypothetical protein DUNSADRAFT_3771 [Dunaliella salina]